MSARISPCSPRAITPVPLPVQHRLRAILLHIPWYTIEGAARLAADVGVSRSTISRLLSGKTQPSAGLIRAITDALSRRSGIALETSEVFSRNGAYPTTSACALMNCRGCLPPEAWDGRTDRLKPDWKHARPSEWSRFPLVSTVLSRR